MSSQTATAEQAAPLFYNRVVALSAVEHGNWKIKLSDNYEFTKETNAVLITTVEFLPAACEYPIVFVQKNDAYLPVAVLGLKQDQNLYLGGDGRWRAKYIPAYIRRYPFILSEPPVYTVCIDEAFSGFNEKTGEKLFEKNQHSVYLEKMISFLQSYQSQGKATEDFCKQIGKLNILEPMQADITSETGEVFSLSGFWVVNKEKLKQIKPLELTRWVKSDDISLVYAHLASMRHFNELVERYSKVSQSAWLKQDSFG